MNLTKNMKKILIGLTVTMTMIFLIGYVKKLMKTREGLENPAHTEFISKGIKNDVESLKDSLHLAKYQSNYKEILQDLAQWCDLEIMKTIATNKINLDDGMTTQNTELLTSMNQWAQFRDTLRSLHTNLLSGVSQ